MSAPRMRPRAPKVVALIAFERFEDLPPEGEHRADQQRGKRIDDPEQESVDHVIAPCEPPTHDSTN